MTDTKWTPGPWRVADKNYGWDHFAAVLPEGASGIIANCHIAALSRSHGQTAADARLIAAAPDLYEALAFLWDRYRALADSGDAGFWSAEETNEGKAAIAALAKADG